MMRNENGPPKKSRSSTSSCLECEHYGDEDDRRHRGPPRGSSKGAALLEEEIKGDAQVIRRVGGNERQDW